MMQKLKLPSLFVLTLLAMTIFLPAVGTAYDLRWGGTIGYGGAGVKEQVTLNEAKTTASKSEGPGVGSLFIENLMADDYLLGVEHSFGFRLGPFSAGVSFTGIYGNFYVWGPAPVRVDGNDANSTFFAKRSAPFYGFATGVARADVTRENDLIDSISSSGVYIGFRAGMDKAVDKNLSFRYQVVYNTTFYSSAANPSTLSKFGLEFGLSSFW